MMIINADDWGRSCAETDTALSCFKAGRITSASAMVFMEDSSRAAELAKESGIDVGLHLNLSQPFTGETRSGVLQGYHDAIVRFLASSKYSFLIYNPFLRKQFQHVYQAQVDEFHRLYGSAPSHIDGHRHMHLCANMLLDGIIPRCEKVRRNLSFWPGEKNLLNRSYRGLVDRWLVRRYRLTDFFFALSQNMPGERMMRVAELAISATVELMTHPGKANEYAYLMSEDYLAMLRKLKTGTYVLV